MSIHQSEETLDRINQTLEALGENLERLMQVSVKQSATARLQLAISEQNLEAVKYGSPTVIQELATISQQINALGEVARSFQDAIRDVGGDPTGLEPVRLRSKRRRHHCGGLISQIRRLNP